MQARDVAQQVVKAHARHAAGGVLVDAVEARHDVHMVRHLEIGDERLAEALRLNVAAVVRADGHGGVDDVRDHIEDLADARVHVRDLLVERRAALVVRLDGGVVLVDLRLQLGLFGLVGALFELAVQRAVGLGELVTRGL